MSLLVFPTSVDNLSPQIRNKRLLCNLIEEIRELKKKTISLNERRVIISIIQNSKLFKRRIRALMARRGESGSRFQSTG